MNCKRILGISRSPRFSPNSEERDAAIFHAVATCLRERGANVTTVCEDELSIVGRPDAIFSMARGETVSRLMAQVPDVPTINQPQSIVNNRARLQQLQLLRHKLPSACPPYAPLPSTDTEGLKALLPAWLKTNGDGETATDVRYVETTHELLEALEEGKVRYVLLMKHITGDLVKFYGVADTFFHWQYATPPDAASASFSKFGNERINGRAAGYEFDAKALQSIAATAARTIGFDIFGGDAVITAQGEIFIIDFNDWPSFSSCREEAAEAIAKHLWKQLN